MDLIQQLYRQAYSDPNPSMSLDLQGWCHCGFKSTFELALNHVGFNRDRDFDAHPLIVYEVGSWKGLSASVMAQDLKNKNINGKIVCIDTWLGSPEHMQWTKVLGQRVNGVPQIYNQFVSNMQHLDLQKYVYPFPCASVQAGHFLESNQAFADIIYIDAAHQYEAVKLDTEVFWRILNPGGVMIFNDFNHGWPGVVKAIKEFAGNKKLEVKTTFDVAYIQKAVA